jgi:hypothetical protein
MRFTQEVRLTDGTVALVGGSTVEELAENVAALLESFDARARRRKWVADLEDSWGAVKPLLRAHLDGEEPTGTTAQLLAYLYDRVQQLTRVIAGVPGTPGVGDALVTIARVGEAQIERAENLHLPD